MSCVIVTGGAGRLGISMVQALAQAGYDVVSVDRATHDGLPARQVQLDLLDREATAALFAQCGPEAVVHLAAISVPFSSPEAEIFQTNTSLAYSVIEAGLAAGAQRLLFASSPTVIGYGSPGGWAPAYLPIDEDHPVAPWNGYALSKFAVEKMVEMAVRNDGDRATFGIFRPCYVISPEEWAGAPTQQGHTVEERLDDASLSAVALFNYVDARDAGQFVLAWLRHADEVPNGTCFFVAAADSLVRDPVATSLARFLPEAAAAARGLGSTDPVFSSKRAQSLLGWIPVHSWRDELAERAEVKEADVG